MKTRICEKKTRICGNNWFFLPSFACSVRDKFFGQSKFDWKEEERDDTAVRNIKLSAKSLRKNSIFIH